MGFVREAQEGVENHPMNESYLIDSEYQKAKGNDFKSMPLRKQEVGNR